MDCDPMNRLCDVNLDCPNGQRSNGLPISRYSGPLKWPTVQCTTLRYVTLRYVNFDRQNERPSKWIICGCIFVWLQINHIFAPNWIQSKWTVQGRKSKLTLIHR